MAVENFHFRQAPLSKIRSFASHHARLMLRCASKQNPNLVYYSDHVLDYSLVRFHSVVYKNFIVVGYLLSDRVLMHLLCMPFRHFCDPVYFHIDFKDEHAMISSGTRVVRNTFWQLPSVFSPIPYAKLEKLVSVEPVCHPYYHQSEQEFRAELSARLAKVCNYSGKSSRR